MEVVVSRTGATAAGCRRRPSHQPLWLSSTSLTSSICSLQKCLRPWASVQSRPAQSEPRDPRRRVDRRRTVQALQKALQQVRLCTLLPKAATFMESPREGPASTNGSFSTGILVSSQMRAGPRSCDRCESLEMLGRLFCPPARAAQDTVSSPISCHIWYVHITRLLFEERLK